eukprot:405531_1
MDVMLQLLLCVCIVSFVSAAEFDLSKTTIEQLSKYAIARQAIVGAFADKAKLKDTANTTKSILDIRAAAADGFLAGMKARLADYKEGATEAQTNALNKLDDQETTITTYKQNVAQISDIGQIRGKWETMLIVCSATA